MTSLLGITVRVRHVKKLALTLTRNLGAEKLIDTFLL